MCEMVSHLLCPTLCPSHQGLVKSGVYVPPTLVSYTHTYIYIYIYKYTLNQIERYNAFLYLNSYLNQNTRKSTIW